MPAPRILEWIYNSRSGAVNELPWAVAELELRAGLDWHGPFNSKQEALDYYARNKDAHTDWHAPSGWTEQLTQAPSTVGSKAVDTANTIKKDVLGGLDLNQLFLRIGEALLGIVLIAVGIAKLTGTANVVSKLVKAAI